MAEINFRTSSEHVSVTNPNNVSYLRGSEFVDGSIRLVPDVLGINVEMQLRADGVWNDTGIQIAASTIHLGRDLLISGAGEYIETFEKISGENTLLPHIPFNDKGSFAPDAPLLGPLLIHIPVSLDESTVLVGNSFTFTRGTPIKVLFEKIYFKTGTVPATKPVVFTISRDSGAPNDVFWKRTLPVSLMNTVDTEFSVVLDGKSLGIPGVPVNFKMESDAPFSLKADSTGHWYTLVDFRRLSDEEMITESFILANDLSITFSNNRDLARGNFVF